VRTYFLIIVQLRCGKRRGDVKSIEAVKVKTIGSPTFVQMWILERPTAIGGDLLPISMVRPSSALYLVATLPLVSAFAAGVDDFSAVEAQPDTNARSASEVKR